MVQSVVGLIPASNFQFQQAKNNLENINRASENRTGQVKVLSPLARMATKKKSLAPDTVSASKTSFLPSFLPSFMHYLKRQIALLRISQFLHFSAESALLDGEAPQLADHGSRLGPDVLAKHAAKQVEREAPSAKQNVVGHQLARHTLLSGKHEQFTFNLKFKRSERERERERERGREREKEKRASIMVVSTIPILFHHFFIQYINYNACQENNE